jgi:hypothetical protein
MLIERFRNNLSLKNQFVDKKTELKNKRQRKLSTILSTKNFLRGNKNDRIVNN